MNLNLAALNQRLALGPKGLSSVSDIFMSIGHQGIYHYMCLAVDARWGNVTVLLKGELCEKEGKDPMNDEEMMQLCIEGFSKEAEKVFEDVVAEARSKQR